jgi:phage major head subunit gpT-like protein
MSTVVGQKTLERGLRAAFVKAFNNGEDPKETAPFIMETSSDGRDEEYGWLGQSPSMTEWVDERKLKALNDFSYALKNKDYEATLSVDRNSMKDDRLGAVVVRINDLAAKARIHPRTLFFQALVAGTTELGYDGQPFFSASHQDSELSGIQTNIQTGTGTTLAQLKADIEKAEADMRCFKDDVGEPFNEGEIKIGIVCHPTLVSKFRELNTLVQINNSSNGMKGRISVIADSCRLGDTSAAKNSWYFSNVNEGLKPFIRQVRQTPEFGALEGESDNGFMRKQYHYGVDSREVFGYGLWQKMIIVNNA